MSATLNIGKLISEKYMKSTTKFALISKDGKLLHSFYNNNNGSTIETAKLAIKQLKEKCHFEVFMETSSILTFL